MAHDFLIGDAVPLRGRDKASPKAMGADGFTESSLDTGFSGASDDDLPYAILAQTLRFELQQTT